MLRDHIVHIGHLGQVFPQIGRDVLIDSKMLASNSHAVFDFPRWARLSLARYFRVVQTDAPECVGRNFRLCGNITADEDLLQALTLVASGAQPQCAVTVRGSATSGTAI